MRLAPVSDRLRGYAVALLMVGLVIAGSWVGRGFLSSHSTDLLFLVPVLLAAGFYGLGSSLFAAGLGLLAHSVIVIEPIFPDHNHLPDDTATVLVLLIAAVVMGRLGASLRWQTKVASAQAERDRALASFARTLLEAADERTLGNAICREVHRLLGADVVLVGPGVPSTPLIGSHPRLESLDEAALEAAQTAMAQDASDGRGTVSVPRSDWTFYPLLTSRGPVGALGLMVEGGLDPVTAEQESLLRMILDHGAIALERQRLACEVAEVERLREQDRLQSALLSSVSHDLRTPLTSILTAAAQLQGKGRVDPDIVNTLNAEARRLDRYVANLLDMVRLEAGALRLRLEPVDLTDIVAGVLRDLGKGTSLSGIRVEVPVDLPLVRLDPQLFHHCLLNLVDNALRHGKGHGVIIRGERSGEGVDLVVMDEGPGLPPGQEARIFETFVRLVGSDRKGASGLGLAIVKGFANAMGLSVRAANRSERPGATFELRIPRELIVEGMGVDAE